MDYDAVVTQVLTLLQREQRLSHRVLKLRLQVDDDLLAALQEDLIYAKCLAVDEDGRVLVWTGGTSSVPPTASPVPLTAMPPRGVRNVPTITSDGRSAMRNSPLAAVSSERAGRSRSPALAGHSGARRPTSRGG